MLITGIRFPPFGFAIPEMSSKDADLSLGDYGLPHQRSTVHIVLSKNECKGAAAARKVAQLAKALAGVLPEAFGGFEAWRVEKLISLRNSHRGSSMLTQHP